MLHNEVEHDHNVSDSVCIATSQWLQFCAALVCGDREVCCVAKSSLLHRFLIKLAAARSYFLVNSRGGWNPLIYAKHKLFNINHEHFPP